MGTWMIEVINFKFETRINLQSSGNIFLEKWAVGGVTSE